MKIYKPLNLVVPFMRVHPTERKGLVYGNTCMRTFTAALLIVARPSEDPEFGK